MSASDQLIQRASACGVIPTLVIEDINSAIPLAQALHDGGLTVLEITLRTPVALQAIQHIRQALPDLFVAPVLYLMNALRKIRMMQVRSFWSAQATRPRWATTVVRKTSPSCRALLRRVRSWQRLPMAMIF